MDGRTEQGRTDEQSRGGAPNLDGGAEEVPWRAPTRGDDARKTAETKKIRGGQRRGAATGGEDEAATGDNDEPRLAAEESRQR